MRVAIVTGGNRGIGYEVCKNLSEIGFKVILTSRKVEDGIKAVDKINNNVSYFPLDVTLQDDIEKLKNHIIDQFGRLDILINNAGILLDKRGYGKGKICHTEDESDPPDLDCGTGRAVNYNQRIRKEDRTRKIGSRRWEQSWHQ